MRSRPSPAATTVAKCGSRRQPQIVQTHLISPAARPTQESRWLRGGRLFSAQRKAAGIRMEMLVGEQKQDGVALLLSLVSASTR
jgi:hypothetical protein